MATVLSAKQSPRFENNVLCYYEGDTFTLPLIISMEKDGAPVSIGTGDTITVSFVPDGRETAIETLSFTNVQDNTVTIDWNAEMTKKFPRGRYFYRLRFNGERVATLLSDCEVHVE